MQTPVYGLHPWLPHPNHYWMGRRLGRESKKGYDGGWKSSVENIPSTRIPRQPRDGARSGSRVDDGWLRYLVPASQRSSHRTLLPSQCRSQQADQKAYGQSGQDRRYTADHYFRRRQTVLAQRDSHGSLLATSTITSARRHV